MGQRLVLNKVGNRYAKALFEHALATGSVDLMLENLRFVNNLFSLTPLLMDYLCNPCIPSVQKKEMLSTHVSGNVDAVINRLLVLLIDNNRVGSVEALFLAFERMVNNHQQLVQADVTTALPLDELTQARIAKSLEASLGYKQVSIVAKVDPSILGGIVIRLGDTVIDDSYASRLDHLEKSVLQAS